MLHIATLTLLLAPGATGTVGTLPSPLPSLSAIQDEAPPRPKETQKERSRRRIIVLTSGGVLRGPSRSTEAGGWQVRGKGGWTEVPAMAVDTAALERDVVQQFAEQRKDESLSSADLIEWTFQAGLLKEAFQLGDRLLVEHPRDTDLRAACAAAGRFVAGLPERGAADELEALRDLGSLGSPVVREVVVERLVTAAPRKEVLAALQDDIKSKQATRRTFAMQAYGRIFPREDPRSILLHAVYDPSEAARAEASRAVAEIGSREIGAPLVRALSSKSPALRTRAAEALGHTRDEIFVAPLMERLYTLAALPQGGSAGRFPPHAYLFVGTQTAYVQDFDVEVAQGAAVADPVINTLTTGAVLDVGVIGVNKMTPVRAERRAIMGSLRKITGANPGTKFKSWTDWWESEAASAYRKSEGQTGTQVGHD